MKILFICVLLIWISYQIDVSYSTTKIAFLIIDVQNCFLSNGSLAVMDSDAVIPIINSIRSKYETEFSLVALSQDWHCSDHISFASQHPVSQPYEVIQLYYDQNRTRCQSAETCDIQYRVNQTLWPDHCVINTTSANFGSGLTRKVSDRIVRKGYNCEVDSYSAFYDNGGFERTELHSLLQSSGIEVVFVAGLASDFCVYYTSLDALKLGYTTYMIEDASRGVNPTSTSAAVADMNSKGRRGRSTNMLNELGGVTYATVALRIHIIQSAEVGAILQSLTSGAKAVRETKRTLQITFLAFLTAICVSPSYV